MKFHLKSFVAMLVGAVLLVSAAILLILNGWGAGAPAANAPIGSAPPIESGDLLDTSGYENPKVPDLGLACGYTAEQLLAILPDAYVYRTETANADLNLYVTKLQEAGFAFRSKESLADAAGTAIQVSEYRSGDGQSVYLAQMQAMDQMGRIVLKLEGPITAEELKSCKSDTVVDKMTVSILGNQTVAPTEYVRAAMKQLKGKLRYSKSEIVVEGVRIQLDADGLVTVGGKVVIGNILDKSDSFSFLVTFQGGDLEKSDLKVHDRAS